MGTPRGPASTLCFDSTYPRKMSDFVDDIPDLAGRGRDRQEALAPLLLRPRGLVRARQRIKQLAICSHQRRALTASSAPHVSVQHHDDGRQQSSYGRSWPRGSKAHGAHAIHGSGSRLSGARALPETCRRPASPTRRVPHMRQGGASTRGEEARWRALHFEQTEHGCCRWQRSRRLRPWRI